MSHSSGFRLYVVEPQPAEQLLSILLTHGWSLNYYGRINFLPLGDKDDFNWTELELSEVEEIFRVIRQKSSAEELVGITLTWLDTNIGFDVLFEKDHSILFSITVNRRLLANTTFTDINWYLERVIPPLLSNNIKVEQIIWNEHM